MAVHPELSKHLSGKGLTFTDGTPNATISAANNTLDAKALEEIIRVAKVCGYVTSTAAGVLTLAPK